MTGGKEETYKRMLTWNRKWDADCFEVTAVQKSMLHGYDCSV